MSAEQWMTITQLLTLAGVCITAGMTYLQHHWADIQRKALAEADLAERQHLADVIETNRIAEAQALAALLEERTAQLRLQIAQNTTLTQTAVDKATDAFHEANTVNAKIEKLGLAHLELGHKEKKPREDPHPHASK